MSQDDTQLQGTNVEKDPDEWVTGDEEMTGAQESYLHTLATQAHEKIDDELTKIKSEVEQAGSAKESKT